MTDRDELIEAGARALRGEVGSLRDAAAVLDAVESLIRADEKAKHLSIPIVTRATIELATPKICDLLLDEVRAKVEALPVPGNPSSSYRLGYGDAIVNVLALLDGGSDGQG